MKHYVFILTCATLLTGCAVTKSYVPTGGSKADGTVELSYEIGAMETVTVDEAAGLVLAEKRCGAWGYSSAEAFASVKGNCRNSGIYEVCMMTKQYQCLD